MKLHNLFYTFLLLIISFSFLSFDIQGSLAKYNTDEYKVPPYLDLNDTEWADSLLANMTLDEKIGQSFFIAANSHTEIESEYFFKKVDSLIINYHIGGLLFFKSNPNQLVDLISRYQNISKVPLVNSIDAEWGAAMRIDSIHPFPLAMSLGAVQNDSLIYEMGKQIGDELRSLGIHINFAPVLDINNNPNNPIIGMRSFSESREIVYNNSLAYMLGLQDKNILACGKHFPGHGDTEVDSHNELPIILHNQKRLDSIELYPFKKIINKGIGSVMVAHISLPNISNEVNRPATFSEYIIKEMLKKRLDFKGLVITDALNMKGAYSENLKPGEIEFNAFMAGNDILLYPNHIYEAIEMIKEAYYLGLITEDDINKRCRKILLMKQWVGLNVKIFPEKKLINNIERELLERELCKEAITLLKNDSVVLPLNNLFDKNIAYVHIGDGSGDVFFNSLNRYVPIDRFYFSHNLDIKESLKNLMEYDLVISGIHEGNGVNPWNPYKITNKELDFLKKLASQNKTVLTFFTNPYLLNNFSKDDGFSSIIMSYQNNVTFQELSAQLIFGSIGSTGKIPISCGGYNVGEGLDLQKRNIIDFCLPIEVGIDKLNLEKMDSLIHSAIQMKAMPGCQILASRYGRVFYSRSFGYHTYDSIFPVLDTDIYDLASVTKIVAAAPIFMNLMQDSKISLDNNLGEFLDIHDNNERKEMTFLDIFTHQSGLYPWLPFYKLYQHESGDLNDTIFSENKSDFFNLQVADNLFFRDDYLDSIVNTILDYPLLDTKNYRYSDLGFYLFYKILKDNMGISIEDYLQDNFYNPIDAFRIVFNPIDHYSQSGIIPTEDDKVFRKQLLKGYVHDPGVALFGGIGLHAGLFSNSIDLAKFMHIYLNNGTYANKTIFNKYIINFFTSPQFKFTENRRGVFFDKPDLKNQDEGPSSEYASLESYGHSGFTGTLVWADPREEIIFIFLSNRIHPDQSNKILIDEDIRTKAQSIIYESIIK